MVNGCENCWFQIALALFALKKTGAPICKISGKHSFLGVKGGGVRTFFNRLFFFNRGGGV
jgi:hypothetical protein